jgi:octopine/nopaline transport system permease protein
VDREFLIDTAITLLRAVPTTLILVAVSLSLGFALAVPLALLRFSTWRLLRLASYGFSQTVRSVPLLSIIFLVYFGAGQFRGFLDSIGLWVLFRSAWFCGLLALTIEEAAYTAEILRGGIQSVPVSQIEAARACGMRGTLLFRRIVFPIALRNALPAYGNEVVLLIKSTALASTITIVEITGAAQEIIAQSYMPIPVFSMVAAIYLAINVTAMRLIHLLERRLSPDLVGKRAEAAGQVHG